MHLREVAPQPRDGPAIPRERLVARLATPGQARLALLSAPAGFGKTTLLEQWAAGDPRPVRWLDGAGELLGPALAQQPERPSVFVLDGGAPAPSRTLARVALAVPAGSLLVIAGRGAAPRAPARLWAEQAVLELGPRDLAMTHGEAEAVLSAAGVELSAEAAGALIDRLQGWPVVVALAARILATSDDPEAAAASFGAHEPHVAAYLREEILADLPDSLVSLVRPCSVTDVLDPGLCEAIAPGAADAVQELERLGVPLAHPLVREALLDDFDRRAPAAARKARDRAAGWFEERGDLDRAVGLLLGTENIDRAAALMWQLAASHVWDEHSEQLDRWLASIPVGQVESHPVLAGVAAATEVARGRFAHAARWTGFAESALATAPVRLARPVRGRIGLLRALGSAGTPTFADADLGRTDTWRSLACFVDGVGAGLCGDASRATERLEEGVLDGIVDAPGAAALCEAELALQALCAGDWAHGACLAERARGRIEDVALESHVMLALVVAVSAFARAHRGRFEEARADVALAHAATEHADTLPDWYLAQVHLATARAELRLGAFARGREQLRAAGRLADRITDAVALRAWIDEGWQWADAAVASGLAGSDPLTAAELRVLRFLPTHLSFREIGARLYVSANTVKTQAHAIYRKLDASSRSAAVERAARVGLLDVIPGCA